MIDLIDRAKAIESVERATIYKVLGEYFSKREDVVKLIEAVPSENGTTVQKLCNKCSHKEVCCVNLKADAEHLLRLTKCDFFVEAKHE